MSKHAVRSSETWSAAYAAAGALRVPRARARQKAWAHVTADTLISQRPPEVADRAVPGHWEGDLLIGLQRSAIGTLVERSSRFTMLVHLPREDGYGVIARTKNGPALAGYGAITMANALEQTITTLPPQLRRSFDGDWGKELSAHAQFSIASGVKVYFADPKSPWQRGTNENTNGLLRQYFPKGTDLSRWTADDVAAIAHTLNTRPRKTLGWRTPAEAFTEHLHSLHQAGVATTIESALATAVGVHDRPDRRADGHGVTQRRDGQRRGHPGVDRVADDPVGVHVLDRAEVELALLGGVLGDVGQPHLVGGLRR